ncbi:MAG: hypothetical protein SF162_15025 [bacterium]|nr:hypothetical protein [bacterium]
MLITGLLGAALVTACSSPPPTPLPVIPNPVQPSPTAPPMSTAVLPSPEAEGVATMVRALATNAQTTPFILPQPRATLGGSTAALRPTALTLGDIPAMENFLRQVPILYQFESPLLHDIYLRGQQNGSSPYMFSVIGDSNSTNGDFLYPLGLDNPNVCSLGAYVELEPAVTWFSTPVNERGQNAFTRSSVTANRGFNSAAIFDPFWASTAVCTPGETPLICEYRTANPFAAVIMLGGIDVNSLTTQTYHDNMNQIVADSIAQGVIPVLTTFVVLPERDLYPLSLEFNLMLVQIAERHRTPLINLWAEAESLPDFGIGPDRTHLRARVGSFCDFTGAQREFGGTLRNLLTLQALDQLRRRLIEGA